MIELTTLGGKRIWVNQELIRTVESAPDTILCMTDGTRMPVRETPEEIRTKIIQFKKEVLSGV
jgi:flagellar protein FlbD